MDQRRLRAIAGLIVGLAYTVFTAMFWLWLLDRGDLFLAATGTIGGSVAIGLCVQLVNRRNEPRHARRSRDTP
jgi:hypothetical protein